MNTLNNNNHEFSSINSLSELKEKRNWVSPEINEWDMEKIENTIGKGADGGTRAYAT